MPPPQQPQLEPSPAASKPPWVLAALVVGLFLATVGYRLLTSPPIDIPLPDEQTQVLLIDINTASEAELAALPRIGPALAKRISEDRSVSGPYLSLDDLDRVPGIGLRTIDAMRPYAVAR